MPNEEISQVDNLLDISEVDKLMECIQEEQEWYSSNKQLGLSQWIELIFPENEQFHIRVILNNRLKYLKQQRNTKISERNNYYNFDFPKYEWFKYQLAQKDLDLLNRQIKDCEWLLVRYQSKNNLTSKDGVRSWEDKKKRAESVQIVDILGRAGFQSYRKTGIERMFQCPFHNDKKPSFCVNTQKNLATCYAGCGGYNVVKLQMKLNNVDYKTAINQLSDI